MKPRRYYLWNIGCQMNRADAYRLGEELEKRGYAPTNQPEAADLVVLNTCVVRQSAEDKVLGRLSSLSSLKRRAQRSALLQTSFDSPYSYRESKLVCVMGCFVDDIQALETRYPYVDAFFKPSDIAGLMHFVEGWEAEQGECPSQRQPLTAPQVSDLVPISYGCNHRCTYCIVTLRRGKQRSRPIAEIVAEARRLVGRGAREITLLGQNVDAYGSDLPDHPTLADILRAIHDIEDLWRIRFLTSHPKDMTQEIIEAAAALPKVCECWELPVQSGDDAILRRMARGYTVEHFRDLVHRIRERIPRSALNTDIIVGFPGETKEQFESTLRLVQETRFDTVHVAAYSVRPGTAASGWEDDVPPEEKERRRALIEDAQTQIAGELNAALLGQEVELLVDGKQRGRWRGRTRTNKLVFFESSDNWLGRLVRVRVTWTGPWSMRGAVLTPTGCQA